jgi:hypothetical protein
MNPSFLSLALAVCLGGVGCATESYKEARKSAEQGLSALVSAERGLVFGERCGGGGFTIGRPNDPTFNVVPGWTDGQQFFFVSLAPGTYTLASVGSPDGSFRGAPPYQFEVEAGKAVYVGAFYPSWLRGRYGTCHYNLSGAVSKKIYRLEAWTGAAREWEVLLLNQPQLAVAGIRAQYPALDLSAHVVRVAR